MKPIIYNTNQHFKEIYSWVVGHERNADSLWVLPSTGRIIPGVCALFLYVTNSPVGFLENLISNPACHPKDISDGIDECILAVVEDAKSYGMKLLRSTTYIPGVVERAKRLGFKVDHKKYSLIFKELYL